MDAEWREVLSALDQCKRKGAWKVAVQKDQVHWEPARLSQALRFGPGIKRGKLCYHPNPENGKRGGGAKGGWGAKPHEETPPTENSSQPPSPRYVFCPTYSISLIKSLRNSPNVLRCPPQKQLSEGLQKWFPRAHLREVLLSGTFCCPPSPANRKKHMRILLIKDLN